MKCFQLICLLIVSILSGLAVAEPSWNDNATLKDWDRGWSEKASTLFIDGESVSLKTPFSLKGQKLSAMVKVEGSAGNMMISLGREKKVLSAWEMSFSKSSLTSRILRDDKRSKGKTISRPDGWMLVELEGSKRGPVLKIDGRTMNHAEGVDLRESHGLSLASDGEIKVQVVEAYLSHVSDVSDSLHSFPSRAMPLPFSWKKRAGNWTVLPFPGEKGGVFALSASEKGRIDSPAVFVDSMELQIRFRFEGSGAIGVAFRETSGDLHRLWFRDHPFGMLLESEDATSKEVLLREGPQFFPGLWYDLRLSYAKGSLKIISEGVVHEVPLSLASGCGLSLISEGTLASFFQITESSNWISEGEARVMTSLRIDESGVMPGGNWIGTPTLSFRPEEGDDWLRVESEEFDAIGSVEGEWVTSGANHVYAQVVSETGPRVDVIKTVEGWWAIGSRKLRSEEKEIEEFGMNPSLLGMLGKEFLSKRRVLKFELLDSELSWSIRAFKEDSDEFLLLGAGGKRLAVVPHTSSKEWNWEFGSSGNANLQDLKTFREGRITREKMHADGRGFSVLGGRFDTNSLPEGGFLTLTEPLLESGTLELNVSSLSHWGLWGFELVDSSGKAHIETRLDLREPPFSLFHIKDDEEKGVVDEPDGDTWSLSFERSGGKITLGQSGEKFGPWSLLTQEPLFLKFSHYEGDLSVSEMRMSWNAGGRSNFVPKSRRRTTMKDWIASSPQKNHPEASFSSVPIGKLLKKSGLSQFHELYFKRAQSISTIGARHRITWTSDQERVQVLFLQLDEGVEVELSVNGVSSQKVMVKNHKFSFLARFLSSGPSFWLAGKKIFEEKALKGKNWKFSVEPDAKRSLSFWREILWRNL